MPTKDQIQYRKETSFLDSVLSDSSDDYVESIALKLIRRLIDNIDPQKYMGTEIATFHILEYFEDKLNFKKFKRENFPLEKERHNKRVKAHNIKTKPYRDALRQLRKDLRTLDEEHQKGPKKDRFDQTTYESKRQDLADQIRTQHAHVSRIDIEQGKPKKYKAYYKLGPKFKRPKLKIDDISRLKNLLSRYLNRTQSLQPHPSHTNLKKLADFFGWSNTDLQVLEFIWATQKSPELRGFHYQILKAAKEDPAKAYFQLIASYLGQPRQDVIKALGADSDMVKSGIVLMPKDGESGAYSLNKIPHINPRILSFLEEPDVNLDTLQKRLFGKSTNDILLTLAENFSFLSSVTDELTSVVKVMHDDPDPCHIILWGDPATGKTTYAQLLARHANKEVVILGESQYDHSTGKQKTLTPEERLNDVLFGFYVTGGSNVVRIIDDAEVLLNIAKPGENDDKSLSKALLLRLLEDGNAIWIVNDIDNIDESVRRRFAYNVEFKPLSTKDRVKEVKRMVAASNVVNLDGEQAAEIAREFVLPTGVYKTAIQHARRTNGGIDAFRRSIMASAKFVFDGVAHVANDEPEHTTYIPSLANFTETKMDYKAEEFFETARHIVGTEKTDSVSILTRGPYGSGKKSLWQHVSHEEDTQYLEADFIGLLNDPEFVINDLVSQIHKNNVTIAWENVQPLFNPHIMSHYPHIVRMVDRAIGNVTKSIKGTHVFIADTTEKAPTWLSSMFVFDVKFDYLKAKHLKKGVPELLGQSVQIPSDAKYITPVSLRNMARRMDAMKQLDEARAVSSMLEESRENAEQQDSFNKDDPSNLTKLLSEWAPKARIIN